VPIRRATVFLIAAVLCAACSSSDDAQSATATSTTTTTTTPVVLYTEAQCAEKATASAQPLQDFVDQYQGLSAAEWNALDPPPDIKAVQDDVIAIAQGAADHGCDPTKLQAGLDDAVNHLEATSEVGKAILAALRGLGPPLGPPQVVPQTTAPRDEDASTVTITHGDDVDAQLRAALDKVAAGSTIEFGAGVFELTQPVVVDIGVNFVGAGSDQTTLSSAAEGVGVAFVGPGGFAMRDLTLEHTGDKEASVLLAIEGPVAIAHAVVRGGVVGADATSGGGHGIVFAFDPIEGFPERTDSERAGPLTITDTAVTGNAAAGILSTGRASPQISESTISDNGGCGLCYVSNARGSVTNTTVQGNEIGVQAGDDTAPRLRESTFSGNHSVGLTFDGASTGSLTSSVVEDNGNVGVQIAGTSPASVTGNTISHQGVGVLATETSTPQIRDNTLADHDVGVQVGGQAHVDLSNNQISRSATVGISLTDTVTGTISGNTIGDATDIGIQASGSATPTITGNTLDGPGSVGISFLETSDGTATGNKVTGREIGFQLGGSATATISDNDIDGVTAVGVLFGEASTGTAENNRVSAPDGVAIMASGTANPEINRNRLRDSAAGLVFRENATGSASFNTLTGHAVGVQIVDQSNPVLDGNIVSDSTEAGVVFGGSARGTLSRNTIVRNGNIGVQVGESARPRVLGNEIRGPGVYAMVYRENAGGEANDNLFADHVFGIQLSDNAAPDITNNRLQGIALTGISYADNTGGDISGNDCGGTTQSALGAGISISAPADPNVGDNNCSLSRSAD
jgi:parallel beta-helix repeat protein